MKNLGARCSRHLISHVRTHWMPSLPNDLNQFLSWISGIFLMMMMIKMGFYMRLFAARLKKWKCFPRGCSLYSAISLSLKSSWKGGRDNQKLGEWKCAQRGAWDEFREEMTGYLVRCHPENQHHTYLVPGNRRLNLQGTPLNVTDGLCQWGICHRKMNVVCQTHVQMSPLGFSPESLGPFQFKLMMNSSFRAFRAWCPQWWVGHMGRPRGIGQIAPGK